MTPIRLNRRRFLGCSAAAGIALAQMLKLKDKDFKTSPAIKWNFTKFLIGRDGEILARFEPMTSMSKVKAAVEAALQ